MLSVKYYNKIIVTCAYPCCLMPRWQKTKTGGRQQEVDESSLSVYCLSLTFKVARLLK